MKKYKYLVLIAIIAITTCFSECSSNQSYCVKNSEGEDFFLENTFGFYNFKTDESPGGNCLGICFTEKVIFEGTLEKYYDKELLIDRNLYDFELLETDNMYIDINDIKDKKLYDILKCIEYFQGNAEDIVYYKDYGHIEKDIVKDLKKDRPTIVGLIDIDNEEVNHAVLAYSYQIYSDKNNNKFLNINVFDPNDNQDYKRKITYNYQTKLWTYNHEPFKGKKLKVYIAEPHKNY